MRYLGQQEVTQMLQLHADGMLFGEIAKKFGVCTATVSNYVHGRTAPRHQHKRLKRPKGTRIKKPYTPPDWTEMDFSKLPDEVLFEHVRECNFIG